MRRERETRINHRIRVPEVRVIAADGSQAGVLQTRDALRMAQDAGLDLVEVSPQAKPPVCKIMDFGKFKYEQDKLKREAKKKQTVVQVKEVKVRPATDQHDLETKLKHIRRFLSEGNKAKITVRFRGREMAHKELGRAMLNRMIEALKEYVKIDQEPRMEGKMLFAVLAPLPEAMKKLKEEIHAKTKDEAGSEKTV
ncbi:MAG: translation initiation factor IF-3 [Deltaproteobacteria bacterium]|nr:translation initiation factor IF-3 [Deltaproteobacteria bacterium]